MECLQEEAWSLPPVFSRVVINSERVQSGSNEVLPFVQVVSLKAGCKDRSKDAPKDS